MAFKSSLRSVAQRISRAVRNSTSSQGLAPADYALAGSSDERTERISLTIGVDRQVDELRLYADTLREIRESFPESPQFTYHIGIVIRRVDDLDEIQFEPTAAEDEVDFTDLLEIP